MKPQTAFFDGSVGPDKGQQILLADDLIGTRGQGCQDIERARAETDRHALPQQKPFARRQRKGTKRYPVARLRGWRYDDVVFHRILSDGWGISGFEIQDLRRRKFDFVATSGDFEAGRDSGRSQDVRLLASANIPS
ncbi:hypothetical protein [Mesorhizobium sp.]|uniref:hypothetical protein n=1 Tax=Mesorhizobium sp. TaxID=1871066 RepID=UPI0034536B51